MGGVELFLQQLLNGLISGAFYALVALGYSLVYGVLKLMNFAHGEIYMAGAFLCLIFYQFTGSLFISICLAMILTAILGWLVYRLAYHPLLNSSPSSLLITAIGASLVLSNGAMFLTNGAYYFFPEQAFSMTGKDSLPVLQITLLVVAVAVMLALQWIVGHSRWGRAMRAVALDRETCFLMGINVNLVVGMTFAAGSALAALAGGLACLYYGGLHYSMGYMMGIKAFAAAVIGGVGSLPGAMLGGLLLGVLEALGTQWLGSAWKDVFAFLLMVLILIFYPRGLLGQQEGGRM